ncbi:unnamed protein product [Paramecium sonneborni]|uniref:RING-type domain-containing protein n=1 Tax=Paramecium sonneborni TaxID=65129 RepID=A0A8S1PMQ5_9CILI|nr:unnamed protein product [Paramecium sonneborni]
MNFSCPQKEHIIKFSSVWDYLNHLQKCHIINERIQIFGETKNEYYFCAFCLQVFEFIAERDSHIPNCKKENLTQIFKDDNLSIPLGKTGKSKIQDLINQYKRQLNSKKSILTSTKEDSFNDQNDVIISADPRLCIPKIEFNQIKARNIPIIDKISFNLLSGHLIMEAAYFKLHNNYKIEQVNREFSFKIKSDKLKQIAITHNFQFTKQLLEESKVLEFCELKLDKNPEIYLQIVQNSHYKSFWLLMPESQNFVKDFCFDEPWCIFNINMIQMLDQKQNITQMPTKKQDPIIQQLQMELQKQEEESKLLKEKLQNSFQDIAQIQEQNQTMIQAQDKKEVTLVQSQIKLREMDFGLENVKEQYNLLNKEKLLSAEQNLNGFYNIQKQIHSHNLSKRIEELNIDYKQKTHKLKKTIQSLENKRDNMVTQFENLKNQIQIKQKQMNSKLAKASSTKQKIQMIKQLLCIQCKQSERNVIQFPCQHFLFCETCFLTKVSTKNFSCPLFDVSECQAEQLSSKYKTVNIINL